MEAAHMAIAAEGKGGAYERLTTKARGHIEK
jgi:hypothetical protein